MRGINKRSEKGEVIIITSPFQLTNQNKNASAVFLASLPKSEFSAFRFVAPPSTLLRYVFYYKTRPLSYS